MILKNEISEIYSWLSTGKNLEITSLCLLIVTAFFGGAWALYTFKANKTDEKLANNTVGDVIGSNNNVMNNSTVNITNNVTFNISPEQYLAKLEEIANSLKNKDPNSAELKLAQNNLENSQKSYEDFIEQIKRQAEEIKRNSNFSAKDKDEALKALSNGDLGKADALYDELIKNSKPSVLGMADAYFQKSKIANSSYRWDDAVKFAQESVRLNPKDEMYQVNLADILLQTGNLNEAKKYYESALHIANSRFGINAYDTADIHTKLGQAYKHAGNLSTAESETNIAITILEKVSNKTSKVNVQLGINYSNLGEIYSYQRLYQQSEVYHLKAIALHEKYLPPNHHDLAIDYNNLGGTYFSQKNYNLAQVYFLKALAIDETNLAFSRASYPNHLYSLALTYLHTNQLRRALPILLKSIDLYEKYPPINAVQLELNYFDLGNVYYELGNYSEAERHLERAANFSFKSFGPNDGRTKMAISRYILCLKSQNKDISHALDKYGYGVKPSNM